MKAFYDWYILGKETHGDCDYNNHCSFYSAWLLQQRNVCFGARDNQYGRFTITDEGRLLGLRLVHKSGSVSCHSTHKSNWGCKSERIGIAITDNRNTRIFPGSNDAFDWYGASSWYRLVGYSSTSNELVFEDPSFSKNVVAGMIICHDLL